MNPSFIHIKVDSYNPFPTKHQPVIGQTDSVTPAILPKADPKKWWHQGALQFIICTWRLNQMSNEKNPGWLGYIGDYTTQVYRDSNKPL